MSLVYGVDSIMPANTRLTNGYLLYDWVMRKSCFPSFWGRSLTGDGVITQPEIEFLQSKNCKIAFILRDFSESEISGIDGSESAVRAITAAKKIGIPKNKGIALFAEIKSEFSVNHNWMISFAYNLANNGYVPGFIGNTDSSKNFNFDRQCSHYVQATRKVNEYNAVYWSTEPKYTFNPNIWAPYAPSEQLPKDMDLWQFGTIDFHSVHANKNYAHSTAVMKYFM